MTGYSSGVFGWSAARRIGVALALALPLWGAVAWALSAR